MKNTEHHKAEDREMTGTVVRFTNSRRFGKYGRRFFIFLGDEFAGVAERDADGIWFTRSRKSPAIDMLEGYGHATRFKSFIRRAYSHNVKVFAETSDPEPVERMARD